MNETETIESLKGKITQIDLEQTAIQKDYREKKNKLSQQLTILLRNQYPFIYTIHAKATNGNSFDACYFSTKEHAQSIISRYGNTSTSGNLKWKYTIGVRESTDLRDDQILSLDNVPYNFPYDD